MEKGKVIDLKEAALERHPVRCMVELTYYSDRVAYKIFGVEEGLRDRQAIAKAFKAAAEDMEGPNA